MNSEQGKGYPQDWAKVSKAKPIVRDTANAVVRKKCQLNFTMLSLGRGHHGEAWLNFLSGTFKI